MPETHQFYQNPKKVFPLQPMDRNGELFLRNFLRIYADSTTD